MEDGKAREPITRDVFRRVMGSFASGVTVITATGKDGVPEGLHGQRGNVPFGRAEDASRMRE